MTQQQLLYNASEAATFLGVSPSSLQRLRKANRKFPAPRAASGIGARWTRDDLTRFVNSLPKGETRTPTEANAAVRAKRKQVATN